MSTDPGGGHPGRRNGIPDRRELLPSVVWRRVPSPDLDGLDVCAYYLSSYHAWQQPGREYCR
eukprot:CAMPEP_0204199620 /NCGR_PEP_ID=MMETSP0361-20130328/66138_1 /ASSEMBLY_ACC=CAM_ASM_000343 /TAXON_ID=268821 /ORGANISM="Scrippsiella Hangoei, Strain SHTV-5" /LENGTH=61 /DNA_ID=CAMNT_0051161931 /DNA_START=63 /DNA_END=244 /DNA_ORIENTATION=+